MEPNQHVGRILVADPVALRAVRESHSVWLEVSSSRILVVDDVGVGRNKSVDNPISS